jgi:hypothetical protein
MFFQNASDFQSFAVLRLREMTNEPKLFAVLTKKALRVLINSAVYVTIL